MLHYLLTFSYFKLILEPFMSSSFGLRLLELLSGDFNMPSPHNNAAANSPPGTQGRIFLVLVCCTMVWALLFRTLARWLLLPTVDRFLASRLQQQQQQRQQQQQQQHRAHVNAVRHRRNALAMRREQENREYEERMQARDRQAVRIIEAQEAGAAARRGRDYGAQLRHELELALEFAAQFDEANERQHFQPERGSALFDSDDEDPEVIRGDKKAKKDQ